MALAVLSVGVSDAQLKKFIVKDMGILPGGIVNVPKKVNLDGISVGYAQRTNTTSAFLFDNPILYDLGVLPGRNTARANWINRFNLVAGTSGTGSSAQGFVWNNGTMNALPGFGFPTEGVAINDNGFVLMNQDKSGLPLGTMYKDASVILGATVVPVPPPAGFLHVDGDVISNLNWVGGTGPKDDGSVRGWIWQLPPATATPTELNVSLDNGELPVFTDMSDVSFDGSGIPSVTGTTGPFVKDGNGVPTYYQPTAFITLSSSPLYPILLDGDSIGEINGVNNDAMLVGRSGRFELRNGVGIYSWRACVFLPLLLFEPFWIAIPIEPYMPANTGIVLDNLTDVNDRGQIIGTYSQAGVIRSLILTPTITPISVVTDSNTIPGGFSMDGGVTIDDTAPFGGILVNLSTNNAIVKVPATVTVPAGETGADFQIDTSPVNATTPVKIIASKDGYSVSVTILVQPTALDRLTITPNFITGGQKANAIVFLAGAAKTGGFKVNLASSNVNAAIVPSSVTVPANLSQAGFFVYTIAVQQNTPVVISASAQGITRTANITVATPFLDILSLAATQCFGGQQVSGYVQISGPARSPGAVVTLKSSSPGVASVPSSVTVLTGTQVASFKVTTVRIRFNTNVTISGTFNTQTRTKTLLVRGAALYSVTATPTTTVGGTFISGKVTMDWYPFTGGAVVSLTSSNVGVASVPATVTVPDTNNKVNFVISTKPVLASTDVTITGTYLGVTKTATITVTP